MPNSYPLPKFSFRVTVSGEEMYCTEVSGIEAAVEPIEWRHGAMLTATKLKMPGLVAYTNLTIKQGTVARDTALFQWFTANRFGTTERRDMTVSLLNEERDEVMTWSFADCFVVKYTASELNATGNEAAIKTAEIAYNSFTVE